MEASMDLVIPLMSINVSQVSVHDFSEPSLFPFAMYNCMSHGISESSFTQRNHYALKFQCGSLKSCVRNQSTFFYYHPKFWVGTAEALKTKFVFLFHLFVEQF